MVNRHLNVVFKRNYASRVVEQGSDDDYEPSQLPTPTKRARTGSPTGPRPSFLAALDANEHIAQSSVIDDDVGSQDFLEKLLESRGLDPAILTSEDINNGDSDIEQQEYQMESQKVFSSSPAPPSPSKDLSQGWEYRIEVDTFAEIAAAEENASKFCPHSDAPCRCSNFLMQQWYALNDCLANERKENNQLLAKNFRQNVRLERLQHTLSKTLELLDPKQVQEHKHLLKAAAELVETKELLRDAQMQAKEARVAQKMAEECLQESNSLRRQAIELLQG
ncbi:hypothetical protein BT96DRAFT_1016704 [Gymnopus androsaceus JB14]|uniref:Uncharacterized protein n=1 Tax=Gymnopus androsaceus JB14 TaxID=1447944 RepID=A0A6A4I064_9AGAR|nr:hypothetical protein BT96DRAFT_1016704 [Gymnopus androsaceus JB14]